MDFLARNAVDHDGMGSASRKTPAMVNHLSKVWGLVSKAGLPARCEEDRSLADIPEAVAPAGAFSRKALVVLGMHRSGTSALTRVLSLLGGDLPRHLMPPMPGNNDGGFWESRPLADLHDQVLGEAGSSWDDISPLPRQWHLSPRAQGHVARFVRCLDEEFGESAFFVLKDPRICQLVPFWLQIFRQSCVTPYFVLTVRNPLEVAQSLRVRDGFLLSKSLMLWLRHVLEAEFATRGQPRSFVAYDELLRDWRRVAKKIRRELHLRWPRDSFRARREIEYYLSPSARHHVISDDELYRHAGVPEWVKTAYAAVRRMVRRDGVEERARLDTVRRDLATADQAFGPIITEYKIQNKHLRQQRQAQAEWQGPELARRDRQAAGERL